MEEKVQQTKKQLFAEIFRFLIVGGLATAVDYCVFWLFDAIIFPAIFPQTAFFTTLALILSVALGFCVGLIINWMLSVCFVFRETGKEVTVQSKKEFLIFTVIGVFGLILNELGMLLLVWLLPEITLFHSTQFLKMPWKKWLAKCIVTLVVLVCNYIGRKKLIFNK